MPNVITKVSIENYISLYLNDKKITLDSHDTEWRHAIKSFSTRYNLAKTISYLLSDNLVNQRVVRIAQELIDLGENVGNFKIKPGIVFHDISGRTPHTAEASRAWDILSNVITLQRQKYGAVKPDYKAEALLTGIYNDCVFLVSQSFHHADLVTVSKRLQLQGHNVASFVYVD